MSRVQSSKLATLWSALFDTEKQINEVILPLASHLSLEDPQLMIALEELAQRIDDHFKKFKLEAVTVRSREAADRFSRL